MEDPNKIENELHKLKRSVSWLWVLVCALAVCVIILCVRHNQVVSAINDLQSSIITIFDHINIQIDVESFLIKSLNELLECLGKTGSTLR